jgi:hypothetical protein
MKPVFASQQPARPTSRPSLLLNTHIANYAHVAKYAHVAHVAKYAHVAKQCAHVDKKLRTLLKYVAKIFTRWGGLYP